MNPMNPMANMNAMGGPVGGGMPVAMGNPGLVPQGNMQPKLDMEKSRTVLNTYIYDYFLREGMYDSARALLNSEQAINVAKDSPGRQNGNGPGDDPMDTDNKDDLDSKRPPDLPAPNLPVISENSFLFEWFGLFWDMLSAQRNKSMVSATMNQYINHTQAQSRLKQTAQQDMLRQMRPGPDGAMPQGFNPAMMRNMPNGMAMNMKPTNLARTAMANNQNNPQAMMLQQQAAAAKQNQMQRDPSDMDGNRRPGSPGSTDNAPSPSKRPRLDGAAPFNPQQAGMVPNGRPPQQGMPGQPVANQSTAAQHASQMLMQNGINPASLSPQQFQNFQNQPPATQQKSIQAYSQNLQKHQMGQINQMPNNPAQNPAGPQTHSSPMMAQGPNSTDLNNFYNPDGMGAPGGMRPGPGNGQGGGSNHALQDYQMQLMLLEQQNKKRLMMARQEQDSMGGVPRADGPGGPGGAPGPNGQAFPDASPQGGVRPGASPNPAEQMKRGTPQMTPAGMPSPVPENMDPSMAPHFFKGGMNGMEGANMAAVGMNGNMRPPSSHPGQPFNGQMNPQMMARQPGQAGPQMQWQGGPNAANPMVQQGPGGPVQGTPQQRAMPPPSAPGPNNANARTQPSSPAQSTAAPPTPQQGNKPAPKKKDTKNSKAKAAANKKGAGATGATPASEAAQEPDATPATPITPVNPAGSFAKGQAGPPQPMPSGQASAAPAVPAAVAPQAQPDPAQGGYGLDNSGIVEFPNMDFAPLASNDVLEAFDFDSFLHDGDGDGGAFDFNQTFMENEIGAD